MAPPAAALPAADLPAAVPTSVTGPSEFTFWGYTWETHSGSAPPVGNVNGNLGTFDPMNVSVGSELVLSLTQTQSGGQILSSGSEVMTKHTFSYGTFEFTSRVVNVLSGSDSSGFLYASNSETEIDMEQVGNKPDAVDCTNWNGVSNFQDTEVTGFNQGNSHDFKIVWQPRFVDWYVDGQLVVIPRRCPALPLHFCLICGARTSRVGEERRPLDPRGTCTSATSSTLRNTLRGRRDRMEGCGFRSCPSSSAEHVRLWPP